MKKVLIIWIMLALGLVIATAMATTDSDWYSIKDWSSKDGKGLIQESDLQRLRGLNLVQATGYSFEPEAWPIGYIELRAWLSSSEVSANMAYQLSGYLAISDLNVNIKNFDGTTLIYAPGTMSADSSGYATLNAVMAEANTELGQHPMTPPGSPYREYQEALKNSLKNINDTMYIDKVVISGAITDETPSTIYCWGDNTYGQLASPSGDDYTVTVAGHHHNLALHEDGSIEAWGADDCGQVSNTPSDSGYSAIAAGYSHSVAIKDGSIIDWGDGVIDNTPIDDDFIAVDAGTYHSIALDSDGNIEAWGLDIWGQASNPPAPPPGFHYSAIAAGEEFNLGLLTNGTIAYNTIIVWGNESSLAFIEKPTDTGYVAIAAGHLHALALRSDGSINAWGWNLYGQADDPPDPPGEVTYVAISAGQEYSCALRSDGTLYSWGRATSSAVTDTPTNNGFVSMSAGYFHNTALNPLDILPPGSVTNLQNTTCTNISITWSWTNPSDTDFDRVDLYLDGAFMESVGSGLQTYTASGLLPNTEYTLGTKTVDASGNTNPEMVNDSAWTAPEARFSASPTSGISVLTVQFTDESPGSGPLTYEWDMNNDGSMDSEEQNPSISFPAGTYDVKLTVTGPGGSDDEIKVGYINVLYVQPLPGQALPPTDPDSDGTYEDLNGNGETDFNDVQLLFRWMDWIQENEPVSLFDLNNNNEIDFNDVQLLFREV